MPAMHLYGPGHTFAQPRPGPHGAQAHMGPETGQLQNRGALSGRTSRTNFPGFIWFYTILYCFLHDFILFYVILI